MAYKHQQNVKDGEVILDETDPNPTKGSLIHVKDIGGKARPLKTNVDGDIPVAPQGQVVATDPAAGKKGSLLYVEDSAGNAQTLKTNADGDIPVAPQGQVVAGVAAATKKGPLIHVEDNAGNAQTLKTNAQGDVPVAPQGQVNAGDAAATKKGSLLYVEDVAGNAQTLKTNADGDIPVAPRDIILGGDPVAGIKGPLVHVANDVGDATPLTLEPDGSVKVSQTQLPPPVVGQQNVTRFLTGSLGTAGIIRDGVTLQQGVDGSVTPVEFFIGSHLDYDIHVMQVTIVIGDAAVTHNNFGNVSPLTNGWTLEIQEAGETNEIILNAKTGGEMIAQSGFSNPFGDGLGSFELVNWDGNSDASIITIPIYQWLPNGLRIGRNSNDELRSRVSDDLTGLQHFEVRVFGFKNFPV